LIPKAEVSSLRLLLQASSKGDATADRALAQASSLLQKVRWTGSELRAGVKTLKGGAVMRLANALGQGGQVRLRLVGDFRGRLQSIEGIYDVSYQPAREGEVQPEQLTSSLDAYKQSLLGKVQMRMAQHKPMQAASRLWSLAVLSDDQSLRDRLAPVLASREAALAQVESDSNLALEALLMKQPPYGAIAASARLMKHVLSATASSADVALVSLPNDLEEVGRALLHQYHHNDYQFDASHAVKVFKKVRDSLRQTVGTQSERLMQSVLSTTSSPAVASDSTKRTAATHRTEQKALQYHTGPAPQVVVSELPEAAWLESIRAP